METLGTVTKTIFLKERNHAIHEEFDVVGLYHLLTFDAALVTSNTIDGFVGGSAIAQVTFATDSDTTMAAVAAAIGAIPGVKEAHVIEVAAGTTNDRVIHVTPENGATGISLTGFVVAAGASQAGVVASTVNSNIYKGMPVEINTTSGKIQPVTASAAQTNQIGIALHDAVEGETCTVVLKGTTMVYGEFSITSGLPGPVKWVAHNTTSGYSKYSSTSVTAANQSGWALDSGTSIGDVTRVILK